MAKINLEKNIYLYGKYYSFSAGGFSPREEHYDLIIYLNPKVHDRVIGSLNGFFISDNKIEDSKSNLLCRFDEMKDFEKMYNGKFIPFEK